MAFQLSVKQFMVSVEQFYTWFLKLWLGGTARIKYIFLFLKKKKEIQTVLVKFDFLRNLYLLL